MIRFALIATLLATSSRADCPIVDRGSPTDGITTITEIMAPQPCAQIDPWIGWQCATWESRANDNDAVYTIDIRWNREGLLCKGTVLWLRGGNSSRFHRALPFARVVQDSLDDEQIRSVEVRIVSPGTKAYPKNGFPNIGAVITDVWEQALTDGLVKGRRVHAGVSAGAMQGANALAYHRLEKIIDGALFCGGPFWTDLEATCTDSLSAIFAPSYVRQDVDTWNYTDTGGGSPCDSMVADPEPPWECRSTLGGEADLSYPELKVRVVIGTNDSYNPWMTAAATDYLNTISCKEKSLDTPTASHVVWDSVEGAALALELLRDLVKQDSGVIE